MRGSLLKEKQLYVGLSRPLPKYGRFGDYGCHVDMRTDDFANAVKAKQGVAYGNHGIAGNAES